MRTVRVPSKSLRAGTTGELALEPQQIVRERIDERGLDRVLDDRVAVARDPREVFVARVRPTSAAAAAFFSLSFCSSASDRRARSPRGTGRGSSRRG
jgi:hypothetical protein